MGSRRWRYARSIAHQSVFENGYATSGPITQSIGIITGGTLTALSTGGMTLGDTNLVAVLGASTNTGAGSFTLVDGQALTVAGVVDAGTQNLSLTSSGLLAVNAGLTANYRQPYYAPLGEQVSASPYLLWSFAPKWRVSTYLLTGFSKASPRIGGGIRLILLSSV